MRETEGQLLRSMQHEAEVLAEALDVAARSLRAAQWHVEAHVPGVRGLVDVDAEDALNAVTDAQRAIGHHGALLGAYAAMGGYPLGRIGDALGLTDTGAAVRLAQTEPLAGLVRGQRVTRRDLAMAYRRLIDSEQQAKKESG